MLNRLKEVFASFQRHDVRYLVIGGIASILYGVPRATFDLDILIDATSENTKCLLDALVEAGLYTAELVSVEEVLENEITVFKDLLRIDVQTFSPGLEFEKNWTRRNTMEYQGQEFHVLSREDLIASKRASGRDVDLEDVRLLELPDEE